MSLPKLNTPTYELILPSTGKPVKFRPFLVKEHKVLLTMSEADDREVARIVKDVVDVCTFNKLDVDKLAHFDVEYIFLQLRSKSIGESVDVVLNCECGEKISTSFSIENLAIEKHPNHTNKIMITEEYGVEMNYPVFDEVMAIFSSNDSSRIIDLIITSIKGIFDADSYWGAKEQTREELEEFIYSLTKPQFEKIEQFFVTSPKVVQVIEADCPSCGKHNVSKLEGLSNFFV